MYVKLPPGDLNPDSYPLYSTSTYTYGVTIALRVCSGQIEFFNIKLICIFIKYRSGFF